jgi:hypothetical protein
MSGAARYKSAWLEPDHVRLEACKSWWDRNANGPAARGPLPADQDPWRGRDPVRPAGDDESAQVWQAVADAGHWFCRGFTRDSRDPEGQVTCVCNAVIPVPEGVAA